MATEELERPRATPRQINMARMIYCGHPFDGDLQIDDDAVISEADDGVWVQAWVWLSKPDEGAP